VYQKLVKSTHF